MSFLLKILWRIIPTRSRLHRIKPRLYANSTCQLCPQGLAPMEETLEHALMDCKANMGLPRRLLQVLQSHQPGATTRTVVTLDLELEPSLELPMTWVIGTMMSSISAQREEGRVSIGKTRTDLESGCRLLRATRIGSLTNAATLAEIIVRDFLVGI